MIWHFPMNPFKGNMLPVEGSSVPERASGNPHACRFSNGFWHRIVKYNSRVEVNAKCILPSPLAFYQQFAKTTASP